MFGIKKVNQQKGTGNKSAASAPPIMDLRNLTKNLGGSAKKSTKKKICQLDSIKHKCTKGKSEEYLKIDNGLMMIKFLHDEKRKKKLNPLECRRE